MRMQIRKYLLSVYIQVPAGKILSRDKALVNCHQPHVEQGSLIFLKPKYHADEIVRNCNKKVVGSWQLTD